MAFNTYQLNFKVAHMVGTLIAVDGPYDKYGYVISRADKDTNGDYLHTIKGNGNDSRILSPEQRRKEIHIVK